MTPERLRRDDRRDDEAPPVERLEQQHDTTIAERSGEERRAAAGELGARDGCKDERDGSPGQPSSRTPPAPGSASVCLTSRASGSSVVPHRERDRPEQREDEADALEVLGSRALAREQDAAADDERRTEDEPGDERLVEEDERDRDREERRRPDRRPTSATRPHRVPRT